jgi:LysR family transcriptional regulator, transcriptional activator of nhaA
MEWLNYHHLLYFWIVAREGSLVRASAKIRLSPSTVSSQIRALENATGEKLFIRKSRGLELTDMGRVVYRYAEEIFTLGRELQNTLAGRPVDKPTSLVVGVADVLPKLVARLLLEPALRLTGPVHLICRDDKPERLFAELAVHGLDVVLSDAPVGPSARDRVFSHLLGECDVTLFASEPLAAIHRRGFPRSLDGAPFLLPTENTALRRSLDHWFAAQSIRPHVVGEFEDSALLKVFGQTGTGIFAAASVISKEVQRQYQVRPIGRLGDVRERFYAISVDRRLKHPAVVAISEEAKNKIFG